MACIPIIFGFPTKIKQDDEVGPARMCPHCHNAGVVGATSRTWFELFWIPLIPFKKKSIWKCGVCQWQMKKGDGYDPQPPGPGQQTAGQQFGGHMSGGYSQYPPPPPPGMGGPAKH
ncbi:hypothetical protein CcaverHIS002_0409680 [Cutaneotrichosporon cavernicola]|uniref:Zinc-ribbon 15 domain-containing protein n=1 Tax=Cutaneotrichosporon cavernicola TaxID=279322 RepID=A0AA48L570_9TREE|nr:uncharacterized protein CcaverHIS019_0409600 [Cutaneotrichosporon cavernicola]BEI84364.1 hypothetical protein CcaverHIS002_0409680 [Cutaneotrichosporon cavernicola]BEI92140.1 hypothetical protein CcaverHIS019_0409600 [Cutaneotrichosporon cavernicola]BEI99910.1 hypothetical protein CcaverHIS631_0409530 [Cutaneotrichosporon cavernicola]BEJ07685.1 hypothetical protein CcaverHIS641_0409540 [Cutaneotrichosporon cavernicola]